MAMKTFLDCNIVLQPIEGGLLPFEEVARGESALAVLISRALSGRVKLAASAHVLQTCAHVAGVKGWASEDKALEWVTNLFGRLIRSGCMIFDPTGEDHAALEARARRGDGAEDSEDEAVLAGCVRVGAEFLATNDTVLASVASRRGLRVVGSSEIRKW